jgi:UDP-glucose 4-epimerase
VNATIALTGATGFLGRYIVRALTARGARVVGVVRNPNKVPALVAEGVELRRADLAEPDLLARGFAGADAVVSNAALLPVRNWRRADHLRTNVRGTENVLAAAVAAGVRRLVHVSSVSAYAGRAPIPVSEDHPLLGEDAGRLTPAYGLSKALAERRAWQLAREHRLALTTVRPCLIYGAFDTNFMPIFVALAKLPIAVMPACTWLAMVYAGDVAEAVALALEKPVAIGRAYNVEGEGMSIWRFFRAWREAGGRSARLAVPVPFPYRRAYDTTRARTELGWRSRPVDEALRETLALETRPWRR